MKSNLRSVLLNQLANRLGYFVAPRTPPEPLAALIRRFRPVETAFPLIRLGPEGDGGYLVPDDLQNLVACFSPGVGQLSGFEADCLERGIPVFLADGTVAGPSLPLPGAVFTRKNLGLSETETEMGLDRWVSESAPPEGDLMLQMDIEGDEWAVLASASDALLRRMRVIVVEFHRLDQLWHAQFFRVASSVLLRLLQYHHCVHLHPNNNRAPFVMNGLIIPHIMEFTFLRRDRAPALQHRQNFPHPLDRDNLDRPKVPLPRTWYADDGWMG